MTNDGEVDDRHVGGSPRNTSRLLERNCLNRTFSWWVASSQPGELIPEAGGLHRIVQLPLPTCCPDFRTRRRSRSLGFRRSMIAIHQQSAFTSSPPGIPVGDRLSNLQHPAQLLSVNCADGARPRLPVCPQFLSEWGIAGTCGSLMGQPSSCESKAS